MKTPISRRDLLRTSALALGVLPPLSACASLPVPPATPRAGANPGGFRLGVATYTFRELSREQAIRAMQRLALAYVSIKDMHAPLSLPPAQRRAAADEFRAAGITPLSCGNWHLGSEEARIRAVFEYTRDLGVPTLVCQPRREALPILERLVAEYDIRVAIHNHNPGSLWPSPYEIWDAVATMDPRMGICLDVGHSLRAGVDPAEAILRCRERLFDVHLKDNDRPGPGSGDAVVGRGAVDTFSILRALQEIRFPHHVGFEFEMDPEDPLPGLAESVGYVRATAHRLAGR